MQKYEENEYFLSHLICILEGTMNPTMKSGRSSDESIAIKRKRIDAVSPSDRRVTDRHEVLPSSKNLTHSEPSKRPKSGIFFQRDSPTVNISSSSSFA